MKVTKGKKTGRGVEPESDLAHDINTLPTAWSRPSAGNGGSANDWRINGRPIDAIETWHIMARSTRRCY